MSDKVIINLFGIDLYFMDLLTIAVILLFASLVLVKLDKNSEDKEVKKKIVLRNFLFILCITGIFLSAADRKMRNEHKINVNQIIVLDEKAVNDDRSFIYLVTEEFKLGVDVVVLMPQNYNKEKLLNLAEQYNYKILTKDTMEVRYDKEVKGIENDRIIFRKK